MAIQYRVSLTYGGVPFRPDDGSAEAAAAKAAVTRLWATALAAARATGEKDSAA